MMITFRRRILVAMVPLFALLVVLGLTGTVLIYHLGHRIDQILRENYDSVIFMRDLNEALERTDSSFQFAMVGREKQSYQQYQENWKSYEKNLTRETNNITVPGEQELADELTRLSAEYRRLGDSFFAQPEQARDQIYFGRGNTKNLYGLFLDIKRVSGEILKINETNMEDSDRDAKRLARSSRFWYGGGLACGIALAVLLVYSVLRNIPAWPFALLAPR